MAIDGGVLVLTDSFRSPSISTESRLLHDRGGIINPPTGTVSVVVPSYNHAPFITRCLRSIIRQSYRPLELIVIDDGSTDGSSKQIEKVLDDCPFPCDLVSRSHKGLSATLNEGLRRSSGQFFAYLGSDDVWLGSFLASRVSLLEARPNAVLAYGHVFVVDEDDQIVECSKDWANYRDGYVGKMLLHQIVPFSPSVLYRREVVERCLWNEQAGLEDYDLYLRLSAHGEFAFDSQVLSAWRQHRFNKSRNLDFMLAECLKAQRQAVGSLNITIEELAKAGAELKWRYAADFVKAGQKRKAIELVCFNLKGSPSYTSVARMILAMVLPQPALRWRRKSSRLRAMKCYGSVQV
jgi:alpha-1,3-rhamnosyltransferase